MFRITSKKGFHITFANGWTVSVQFGPGNYCDNRDMEIKQDDERAGREGSINAECAFWPANGHLQEFPGEGDTVRGWMTAEDVLALLNDVAARP